MGLGTCHLLSSICPFSFSQGSGPQRPKSVVIDFSDGQEISPNQGDLSLTSQRICDERKQTYFDLSHVESRALHSSGLQSVPIRSHTFFFF